jgi:DNA-binding GntR family transcriptional regulator
VPEADPPRDRGDHAVYDGLRQAIVEGRFPPGARLREAPLAADFGVSRTPVREALLRLENEGLVVLERNRGAHVRTLSVPVIVEVYELRARLEGYAAELAAERAAPEDLARLSAAAAGFGDAVRSAGPIGLEDVRTIDAANRTFHTAILSASRHARVRQLVGRATDAPLVFKAFRTFDHDNLARSALFHDLILESIAAHEPARAGRLMAEHVLQARDTLLAAMTETATDRRR